ncbi:MAG: hypothetical protein WCG52_08830 [bacterium]
MFFSIRSFGFGQNQALIAALIPLLLGILNVAAGLSYSATALVMTLAVAAHLLPAQTQVIKGGWKTIESTITESPSPQNPAAPISAAPAVAPLGQSTTVISSAPIDALPEHTEPGK